MTRGPIKKSLLTIGILLAWIIFSSGQESGRRVYVLGQPDEISEYDARDFKLLQSLKVPAQALETPQALALNSGDAMMFPAGLSQSERSLWYWDGRAAQSIRPESSHGIIHKDDPTDSVDAPIECFLGEQADSIYCFENYCRKKTDNGEGNREISVHTTFRAFETDPKGTRRRELLAFNLPDCDCATGVCPETCPEVAALAPDGVISSFFVLTTWIPGQLGATYQSSSLYHHVQGKWLEEKLPETIHRILDGSTDGSVIVHVIEDSGCCGWDNDSNDQTLLLRRGRTTVLFDERERYENPDYDVSFFTTNARLSNDSRYVAMTFSSSAKTAADMRLSSEGKADEAEEQRIRNGMAQLPAVEILRLSGKPERVVWVPHATLAGWLNETEVLIIENGVGVAYDAVSGKRRATGLRTEDPARVLLR